jgi:methyltransferase
MGVVGWVVAFVALQRLSELGWSRRNERALLAKGGIEMGARHYPAFVFLHTAWLLAILVLAPSSVVHPTALAVFAALQMLRLWVIAALGPYWTTRVITLAGAPLVRSGPYRWIRHPNYWIVVGEIALLPLAFGAYAIAAAFSVLNAGLLLYRVRIEEEALAAREPESAEASTPL